jgi:hypothetical protein
MIRGTEGSHPPRATLRTLRELAAEMGCPLRAARFLLAEAWDTDVAEGRKPDWRTWNGQERSKARFNVSRLRRAHPELFPIGVVDRAEFGQLEERVTELELAEKRRRRTVAVRVRP